MGKQSLCLLFLCLVVLGVIAWYWFLSQGQEQWRLVVNFPTGCDIFTGSFTNSLAKPTGGSLFVPHCTEHVTPVSVPITVCLPEICKQRLCSFLSLHGYQLFWAWVYYVLSLGRVSTHTKIRTQTQHCLGHSLSTSGARLLPPQPDKSSHDTHTQKAPGPQFEWGPVLNFSSNLC